MRPPATRAQAAHGTNGPAGDLGPGVWPGGGAKETRIPDPLLANYLRRGHCQSIAQVTESVMVAASRSVGNAAAVLPCCTRYPAFAGGPLACKVRPKLSGHLSLTPALRSWPSWAVRRLPGSLVATRGGHLACSAGRYYGSLVAEDACWRTSVERSCRVVLPPTRRAGGSGALPPARRCCAVAAERARLLLREDRKSVV